MKYTVEYTPKAEKALQKLDKPTRALLYGWIQKNLVGCENPYMHGKGLVGNRRGQWRYRVGDYRLICDIQEQRVVILVLEVGHRRDIYG